MEVDKPVCARRASMELVDSEARWHEEPHLKDQGYFTQNAFCVFALTMYMRFLLSLG